MSQNIRQADDILFHSVKSERKQVSEIVRKHFLGVHMRLCAQSLHHAPYICAVHRLSRAGDKYRPGGKSLFLQNCSKSPRSSLGRMITRIFPLLDICTCPVCSASTVTKRCSLTRMPVLQIVCKRSESLSLRCDFAAFTNLSYSWRVKSFSGLRKLLRCSLNNLTRHCASPI